MLVPAIILIFTQRWRSIHRAFEIVVIFWMIGFCYALAVSFFANEFLGGLYTFVEFCLPLGFAYWIATRSERSYLWYQRMSATLIVLAVIISIYGIIQFVFVPPWDAAWMQELEIKAFGLPLPFQVRVFSTLNSPATFAVFLTVATVMFLPRLTLRNGMLLLPIFIGLALSLLRASWLSLPVGIIVFAALTTRRKQLLTGVLTFLGIGVLTTVIASFLGASDVGDKLATRFSTLGDVSDDVSAQNRAGQMADAFRTGIADPEGSGLGFVGVSTRLNSADESATTLDSGFMSRFVEMGIPGSLALLISLGVAVSATARVWLESMQAGNHKKQDIAAVALAMQASMLALNLFGDYFSGAAGIVLWTSVALVLRGPLIERRPHLLAKR
jgi:hypothetical protein